MLHLLTCNYLWGKYGDSSTPSYGLYSRICIRKKKKNSYDPRHVSDLNNPQKVKKLINCKKQNQLKNICNRFIFDKSLY